MPKKEDPARTFHLCVTNRDPELVDFCENFLEESDQDEWKENMYHVVLQYHLYKDRPDIGYTFIEKFYDKFKLVRPRLLHVWIEYTTEHDDLTRLVKLISSPLFPIVELSEGIYLKVMELAIKHNDLDTFWIAFDRMAITTQFVSDIKLLQELFSKLGSSCQPVNLDKGLCPCGTKAQYLDRKSIDLKKFSDQANIKIPRLPKGHTIVVDGANVGFYDLPSRIKNQKQTGRKDTGFDRLNWSNVIKIDRFLKNCGHSPLFVFNVRHRGHNRTRVSSFYSPSNINDDLYFTYLAMLLKVPLVSNDDLSDMCLAIDPNIDYWVRRNRICYRFEEKGNIGCYYKDHHRNLYRTETISYSMVIQPHNKGYLVPSLVNEQVAWYCITI